MFEFNVETCIDFPTPKTRRAGELMRLFGLRTERLRQQRLEHRCRLRVRGGDIVYITGASGAGKTVLLNALYAQTDEHDRLRLETIELADDRPLIDCIDQPLFATTETFSRAGLGDVFCMLQTPAALSLGQQHRYRLGRALASTQRFIFADEFTSSLDRITAAVVAYRLRKQSARSGKVFVLASSHEDILPDLQPDILIIKNLTGRAETLYKDKTRDPVNRVRFTGRKQKRSGASRPI